MACGASGAEIAWRTGAFAPALRSANSGGLCNLAATQAPRADADAFGGAVDQRAHGLKVRLEPARPDVVGVRHGAADNRTLIADFAALGHVFLAGSLQLAGHRRLASSNQPRIRTATTHRLATGWVVQTPNYSSFRAARSSGPGWSPALRRRPGRPC